MNGSTNGLTMAARPVSTVAGTTGLAVAAAISIAAVAGAPDDEGADRPSEASGNGVSESPVLEQANAKGRMRVAHAQFRAKAWGHIRNREYDAAIAVLHELQSTEFSEDAALTHHALATAFNFKRDYDQVLHHQARIVEQPGNLPPESVRAALMSAGYLSYQKGRFEDAVRFMEAWREGDEKPPARFFAMLARAYRELGNRSQSILSAKAAMRAAEAEDVAIPPWVEQLAR